MRKVLFVFAVLPFIISCTTVKYLPFSSAAVVNYSFLIEKGIYVSESNQVNFNYEPVSSITVEVRGGEMSQKGKVVNPDADVLYQTREKDKIEVNAEKEGVKRLYDELQKLNANGIINLQVKILPPYPITANVYYGAGYSISGMAIRMK